MFKLTSNLDVKFREYFLPSCDLVCWVFVMLKCMNCSLSQSRIYTITNSSAGIHTRILFRLPPHGQRIVTDVPIGFCIKFGDFHPELRIFLNLSKVIVMHHFVSCSNVYLTIIEKYEDDHHIRDPLTRDLDFPIFLLIDFKFWHVHLRFCHSVRF